MKIDWTSIWTWLGITSLPVLIAFLLNLGKILSWLRNLWRWFLKKLTRYRPKTPKETMRLVVRPHQCRWSMGSSGGEPAMQVVFCCHLTNITDQAIKVCGARIRKPKVNGHVMVRHSSQDLYGGYPVSPKYTTEAVADFWIKPPIRKAGEPLILDLEFIDQFNNIHRVKKVSFHSPRPKRKEIEPTMESIVDIKNPIEKEIVNILQSEVHRYKDCGRRSGGLGSVELTYRGRKFTGVGTDWREANSSKQQSIVPDPQFASIDSDNGTVLLRYHQTLDKKQQEDFLDSLIARISKDKGYAQIGYFFLFLGHRMGCLEKILKRAKSHLQGDAAYGFSDLLRLLDGLLKYEYTKFTTEELDVVEKFLVGVEEHSFRISERIKAIRAYILSKKVNPHQ